MSATAERQLTWPTIEEAEAMAEALEQAWSAVDGFVVRCYGLVDKDEPWDRPDEVPAPTLADVGALTRAVSALQWMVGTGADQLREQWLPELEQLLASASQFEASRRKGEGRRA
jgi:hypothetical protein